MKRMEKTALATAAMALIAGMAHAETRVSVSSGVDYSSGDYGGVTDTEVISVPLGVRVSNGDWTVRSSTPYLRVTGPADVADIGEDGGAGGGGGAFVRTSDESGIGDTTIAVTRAFRRLGGSNAYFEVNSRVRLPTGDEKKGLGVGATDYALGGELGVTERGGGASIGVMRRFLGDRAGVERVDGWQVNTSGWVRTGEKTTVGAFGSWREAARAGRDDPSEVGAYVSHRLTDAWNVTLNAGAGLSDASADLTTGLRFTWRTNVDE